MTSPPVFVDATGRRARLVAVGCWALGSLFGGYVLLVVLALVVPSGTLALTLPGLGPVLPKTEAPPLTTVPGGTGVPASVLARLRTPSPKPSPRPSPRHPAPPAAPAVTAPGVTAQPSSGLPTTSPTAVLSAAPPSGRGNSRATTHPTPHPRSSKSPHP